MVLVLTDEELMQVSTSDLRTLFETKEISAEEHRQLRSRRRRLQNRKYARKCARKKQTEVELLTSEVEEERSQIQLLRRQLSRVRLSTQRMQHQIVRIASFHQDCLKASIASARDCSQPTGSLSSSLSPSCSGKPTLRMVSQDGQQADLAVFDAARIGVTATSTAVVTVSSTASVCPSTSRLRPIVETVPSPPARPAAQVMAPYPRIACGSGQAAARLRLGMHGQCPGLSPVMPMQLAAGPGLPTSQTNHFSPMRLVRPVGCGLASNSSMSEF